MTIIANIITFTLVVTLFAIYLWHRGDFKELILIKRLQLVLNTNEHSLDKLWIYAKSKKGKQHLFFQLRNSWKAVNAPKPSRKSLRLYKETYKVLYECYGKELCRRALN